MVGEGSAAAEADVTEASTAPFALVLVILPNVADQFVHPLLSMFTPFKIQKLYQDIELKLKIIF